MAYPRTRMLHLRTGCATGNVVQKSDPVKRGIHPPGNTGHATYPLTCTDLIPGASRLRRAGEQTTHEFSCFTGFPPHKPLKRLGFRLALGSTPLKRGVIR
jgi:hypothetical protein